MCSLVFVLISNLFNDNNWPQPSNMLRFSPFAYVNQSKTTHPTALKSDKCRSSPSTSPSRTIINESNKTVSHQKGRTAPPEFR